MEIRGFIESSFLDWDGYVTSVIFTPHCNFRCPFCHNHALFNGHPVGAIHELPLHKLEDIEKFLQERKDFIDGVVITGGEPTLQADLPEALARFKKSGFLVKLDTNGTNPLMLKELIKNKLVDYVAMDLKAPLNEQHKNVCGTSFDLDQIKKSVDLIINSGLSYEFRTTVCPRFLDEPQIEALARYIAGADKYILQQFVPQNCLDKTLQDVKPYEKEKLQKMAALCRPHVKECELRGA